MRSFVFSIEDDRTAGPTVRRASVRDELEARKLAARILLETYHHRSVEVLDANRRICMLTAQTA
jgi:hypothetical protein